MDTEDREHFKTIGLASPKLPIASSNKPNGASSHSDQGQASCLKAARTIAACYRKDEAHDPEVYAAAVAAVLSDYSLDIVTLASDPRTGIAGQSKFLPTVAEIKEFCAAVQARQDRIKRYEALPRLQKRAYVPPSHEPNLFVAVGRHCYEKMVERHKREPGFCRFESGHACKDDVARDGLWVPLGWYQDERTA